MMVKVNKIAKTSCIAALSVLVSGLAFGKAGDRGGMSGNSCANINGTTGGVCTVVWYRYQYTTIKQPNTPTYIPEAVNRGAATWGTSLAIGVPGNSSSGNDSCFSESKTFYAKGAAMGRSNGSKVNTIYRSQQFGSAYSTYDSVYGSGTDVNGNTKVSALGDYATGTGANYSYAFAELFTISPSYKSGSTNIYKETGYVASGGTVNSSSFPANYGTIVAQGYIVPTEEAQSAFCVAASKSADCVPDESTTVDGYTFEGDSYPASWFCAKDQVKKEGFTKGSISIVAQDSTGKVLQTASVSEQGNGKVDNQEVIVDSLTDSKITIISNFVGERDDSQTASPGYTLENNPIWRSSITANSGATEEYNGRFDAAALTVANGTRSHTGYLDLHPGDKKTVCSSMTFDHHYKKDNGITTWLPTDDPNYDQTACITIEYTKETPNPTAEVDSDTLATIGSSVYSSHKDGKTDDTQVYNPTVEPGALDIYWSHRIGYKNLSDSSYIGKIQSKTWGLGGVNNGILNHPLEIFAYNNLTEYPLRYYYDDAGVKYPSGSNSNSENSEKTSIFPGESFTKTQALAHPRRVDVSTGDRAQGESASTDEESRVTLNLKANDIKCGLNDAHTYDIGVDHADDYRWLIMERTQNKRDFENPAVIVGDGYDANASLWLSPTDTIRVSQKACFGRQIGIDASNAAENRLDENVWETNGEPFAKMIDGEIVPHASNTAFKITFDTNEDAEIKKSLIWGNHRLRDGIEPDNEPKEDKTYSKNDYKYPENSASWLASSGNASLWASEIGNEGVVNHFHQNSQAKVSTPRERILNNYQIMATNTARSIENNNSFKPLGKTYKTNFLKPNNEAVSITVKVPYNYYMDMTLGGKGILDGETSVDTTFIATVDPKERKNYQVCTGRDVGRDVCDGYATETKSTNAGMVLFTMDSRFKLSDLGAVEEFTVNNDVTGASESILGALAPKLMAINNTYAPSYVANSYKNKIGVVMGNGSGMSKNISLESDTLQYDEYPVGTKICAAVAVYPSDSHDTWINPGDDVVYDVISDTQNAAFSTSGAYSKIKVSCRTVAKHQTISVEGSGILTSGAVNSSKTIYKNREFRSWSEYQIVANGSNASSGAVTAYGLVGANTTTPNNTQDAANAAVSAGKMVYPQSLGNYDMPVIYGVEPKTITEQESASGWVYAESLMQGIIKDYGTKNNICDSGNISSENHNVLYCDSGDVNLTPKDIEDKATIVVRSSGGTVRITNDSHLGDDYSSYWGGEKQIIIIGKNVTIDPDVEKVNAWLIVDGGYLNTCGENSTNYKDSSGKWDGNEHLLDNCSRPLIINGPVMVKGKVILPRTFGGGSEKSGDIIVSNQETYVQRAEIFNFDPSIVKWAYEESEKEPRLETTYVETLAPRL